tara:strand:+ start:2771 stop:2968 length:198 start_codon:yes stop_codon:yes gene_type:complete
MGLDRNLIIGNGSPSILRSNLKNTHVETAQFLKQAEDLETNIKNAQENSTNIGNPLLGKKINVFA